MLKLLEEQHRKLAQIIRNEETSQPEVPQDTAKTVASGSQPGESTTKATSPDPANAATKTRQSAPSLASTRVGSQQRDSSPSLAREMASRRGIPQPGRTVQFPAAQARQQSPEANRTPRTRSTTQIPAPIVDSQADLLQARRAKKMADDEGFAKFYSNITTGTMSKLSSVLAYAGLPLTAEETSPEQNVKHRPDRGTVRASNDPDVKKIFSKAALEAIEDEQRRRGTLGHGFGPAESFYVVQKGGGTYSYADIARSHQQRELSVDDDEPQFVDAKEVQGPTSPKQNRFSQRGSFGSAKTNEELDLENATLKQTLQDLAVRLAAFEAHAQDASFAALTQSVANLRPPGTATAAAPDASLQERIQQLEKQVEGQAEERQRLENLAAKQDRSLRKYQGKFEELKKSAREKDKARKDKAAKEAEVAGGEVPEEG